MESPRILIVKNRGNLPWRQFLYIPGATKSRVKED